MIVAYWWALLGSVGRPGPLDHLFFCRFYGFGAAAND